MKRKGIKKITSILPIFSISIAHSSSIFSMLSNSKFLYQLFNLLILFFSLESKSTYSLVLNGCEEPTHWISLNLLSIGVEFADCDIVGGDLDCAFFLTSNFEKQPLFILLLFSFFCHSSLFLSSCTPFLFDSKNISLRNIWTRFS